MNCILFKTDASLGLFVAMIQIVIVAMHFLVATTEFVAKESVVWDTGEIRVGVNLIIHGDLNGDQISTLVARLGVIHGVKIPGQMVKVQSGIFPIAISICSTLAPDSNSNSIFNLNGNCFPDYLTKLSILIGPMKWDHMVKPNKLLLEFI